MGRAGTGIRSDVSADRGTRAPQAQQPNKVEVEKPAGYRWPELSIVRQTNIEWPNNTESGADWNDFANKLGRMNRGKGKAYSLGTMACSYVTAVEFGKMVDKKQRDREISTDRASTIQWLRRFAKNYNQFVKRNERGSLERMYTAIETKRIVDESDVLAEMFPYSENDMGVEEDNIFIQAVNPASIGWGTKPFKVKGLQKYSRDELGLDLSVNEQLYNERQETIDYCSHEGLDTKFIDRGREPHLVVFQTFGPLGAVALKSPDYPSEITLDPPAALVNSN